MEPRHIYVGSLSRRERAWGRGRRARVAPRLAGSTLLVAAIVIAATILPSWRL